MEENWCVLQNFATSVNAEMAVAKLPGSIMANVAMLKYLEGQRQSLAAVAKLMSIIRWVPCENSKGQG